MIKSQHNLAKGSLALRPTNDSAVSVDAVIKQSEAKLTTRFGMKDREFTRAVKETRKEHAIHVVGELLALEADVTITVAHQRAQEIKLAAAAEEKAHTNAIARELQTMSNEHDRAVVDQAAHTLAANAHMAQAHRKAVEAGDLSPEDKAMVIHGIDMLNVMAAQHNYDRAEIMLTESKQSFARTLTARDRERR